MDLSQAKRDEEMSQIQRELRGPHDKRAGLSDREVPSLLEVPSPAGDVVRHEPTRNVESTTQLLRTSCGPV